jgi:predicted HAD superfamily phosphohydrolase
MSDLFEQIFKCALIAELIHEIEVVGGFEHVEVLDDVWGSLDISKNVDFVDDAVF